jgi:hypothetical protein
MPVPAGLKRSAGRAIAALDPRCRYANCLFLLGHMRCGSTALSNILVSRPDVSGYGEAHVAYRTPSSPGELLLNQRRRGGHKPGARLFFDKILHDRYDAAPDPGFFDARAIFVARAPDEAILSIHSLFETLGSGEYGSDAAAAAYLAGRLETLLALWPRFVPERRLAFTHAAIVADPDAALTRLSAFVGFEPPLANSYAAGERKSAGAGDPINAHRFTQIMPGTSGSSVAGHRRDLAIDAGQRARLALLYARFEALCANDEAGGNTAMSVDG